MTAFPKGTTGKDTGAKAGDKFRMVTSRKGSFSHGDIVELKYDVATDEQVRCCFYKNAQWWGYVAWSDLEPLEPRIPTWETLQEGDVLETDNVEYSLVVQGKMGRIIFLVMSTNQGESK